MIERRACLGMRIPLPQCLEYGELLGITPPAVVPVPTKGIEGLDKKKKKRHPHTSISLAASSARVHLLSTFFQRSALEGVERT
jgi:hypothetical protein